MLVYFSVFEKMHLFLVRFRGGRWLPKNIIRELRAAAALLIFAEADLSLPVDGYLYAFDASLWGGAFGCSSAPQLKTSSEARDLLRHCDVRGTTVRLDQTFTEAAAQPVREPSMRQAAISIDDVDCTVLKACPYGKMHGNFSETADSHITLLEGITYVLLLRHLA